MRRCRGRSAQAAEARPGPRNPPRKAAGRQHRKRLRRNRPIRGARQGQHPSRSQETGGIGGRRLNMSGARTTASVVLVHGAWGDGSSWAHVIDALQRRGLTAVAAPIPLTSLSDDIAALERTLERTDGPVVLVAHAYAGAVIGASTNERVRSLVFVAAL